jgi:hypothetical protein
LTRDSFLPHLIVFFLLPLPQVLTSG